MKHIIGGLLASLSFIHQLALAGISPVLVTSEIKNDTWFPLPLEQMKDAAVDTALTRISETGEFAFLYMPDKSTQKNTGTLNLKVTLIEPAESAKLTIKLTLPDQGGTYVSSSSISLSNKNHKGIFNALEELGREGAEQIYLAIEDQLASNRNTDDENELKENIIQLNKTIIQLDYRINNLDLSAHNNRVNLELKKLDTIISKLDEHHEYAKRSDANKNRKLDAIYSEIKKLNIGANTDNVLPGSNELSEYDLKLLPELTKANDLKYEKRFDDAKLVLTKILRDRNISSMLRSAVNEEKNINLPIYEAEIEKNNLPKFFSMDNQHKNSNYKSKISHIISLYDHALAQPDLSFTKRNEINSKKSEVNLMRENMGVVVSMMNTASKSQLSSQLRVLMNRHNAYRAMGMKTTGNSQCPNEESIKKEMKIARINADIVSYKELEHYKCKLTLTLHNSKRERVTYIFDESFSEYN